MGIFCAENFWRSNMTQIELIDFKGDYWLLTCAMVIIDRVYWYADEGPSFLHENGAHYDVVDTPLFTEWF